MWRLALVLALVGTGCGYDTKGACQKSDTAQATLQPLSDAIDAADLATAQSDATTLGDSLRGADVEAGPETAVGADLRDALTQLDAVNMALAAMPTDFKTATAAITPLTMSMNTLSSDCAIILRQ